MARTGPLSKSAKAFNATLTALFHQRQASLLVRVDKLVKRIDQIFGRLADEIGQKLAAAGKVDYQTINSILANLIEKALKEISAGFVTLAQVGHATAASAIVKAMPLPWLYFMYGMAIQAAQDSGIDVSEEVQWPFYRRDELGKVISQAIDPEEARKLIEKIVLPPPSEEDVRNWLTNEIPGGMSWDARLRKWSELARAAMLNELTVGLANGENVDQLRERIRPFADGVKWKAQRIARTEGNRVAERVARRVFSSLGSIVGGLQIIAVMDEHTRPHHALRHGKIYWKREGEDAYRDESGQPLPDLPDEPNCRCMTIPVIYLPTELDTYDSLSDWASASLLLTKGLPGSYDEWWENATEEEKRKAVGATRYDAIKQKLGGLTPQWQHFVSPEGKLLSRNAIAGMTGDQIVKNSLEVEKIMQERWKDIYRLYQVRGPRPKARTADEATEMEKFMRDLLRLSNNEAARQAEWAAGKRKVDEAVEEVIQRVDYWEQRVRWIPEFDSPAISTDDEIRLLDLRNELIRRNAYQNIREPLVIPKKDRVVFERVFDLKAGEEKYLAELEEGANFVQQFVHKGVVSNPKLSLHTSMWTADHSEYNWTDLKRGIIKITTAASSKAIDMVHETGHYVADLSARYFNRARDFGHKATDGGRIIYDEQLKCYICTRTDGRPFRSPGQRYMMRLYQYELNSIERMRGFTVAGGVLKDVKETAVHFEECSSMPFQNWFADPIAMVRNDPDQLRVLAIGTRPEGWTTSPKRKKGRE